MLVSLIKSTKINTFTLPKRVIGNYWVTDYDDNDNEQNLISIEASDGNWRLVSNDDICIVVDNEEIEYVYLQEYSFYLLKIREKNTYLLLYCSPIYDTTNKRYLINSNQEISIGNNNANAIYYNNSGVDEVHAKLAYYGGRFIITDNNSRLGVYVNNIRVRKQQKLNNGDVIFIAGLKIVTLNENGVPVVVVNNPDNLVKCRSSYLQKQEIKQISQTNALLDTIIEPDDTIDVELYQEDDYFHKKPRFKSSIETLNINIDPPPIKDKENNFSLSLIIGPMITIGLISIIMIIVTLACVLLGSISLIQSLPIVIVAFFLFISIFFWTPFIKRYERKKYKKQEENRQQRYSQYIESKRQKITDSIRSQRQILAENNLSLEECQQVILKHKMNLWERKVGDGDFLTINLGLSVLPMNININYPQEHFSLENDNLNEMVTKLCNEPKTLADAPLTISLYDKNILALIGTKKLNKSYMDRLILQLITFHSYDELKIVLLTTKNNEKSWDYLKILPHCWSNDRSIRFFGTNINEIKEICYHLDRKLSERNVGDGNSNTPYYLIITDCIKTVRTFDVIKDILHLKDNKGFGLLIMNDRISNLPTECKSFINVYEKNSNLFENELNTKYLNFRIDFETKIDMYECAKELANIPIEIENINSALPNQYGFLEMYNVGKVEQLNALNRWTKNNPILTLQAPVGIGVNGEKINLDLHEKFHGPHGLIAGSTGSGKSEFIITYILSMAVNYHPNEVQFILIDYKGGGLAGAFENKELGIKLPHLAGTITNLDAGEIKRCLASLESELKRRQRIFNEAREKLNESTIDIYKYQKLYRSHVVSEPISHLFIITDEFAELKTQQPEFMQQLISIARIGRSLGVHLILATQKPNGVVDNQIWSNTRFRICLRVQEKSDSNDIIKCPDAALIKQTGRFYLQVGYNEIFELGQSAWCGRKYYPTEKLKKTYDTSVDFIDNIGFVIKTADKKKNLDTNTNQGEELNNIVSYLCNIAESENIHTPCLWLDKLPNYFTVASLMKKYEVSSDPFFIAPIIGEYDDPSNQRQEILRIPFVSGGNSVVYGIADSGKENFITSMIFSSMYLYTPEELNYYILDFGSETLSVFADCPLVGDILSSNDNDKIDNLYEMLCNIVSERKKLFASYNGNYDYFSHHSGNKLPVIVTIINNYEVYSELNKNYEDRLKALLREGIKYGVYFVLTVNNPNGIPLKIRQNFGQEYVLQQNNLTDYNLLLGDIANYPQNIKGRGLTKIDNHIYEFQTAYATPKNKDSFVFIKEQCQKCAKEYSLKASKIPFLPKHITFKDVKHELGKKTSTIIGYDCNDYSLVRFHFDQNFVNLVTGESLKKIVTFAKPLIKQISAVNQSNVIVVDAEELKIADGLKNLTYIDSDFDTYLAKFLNLIATYRNNNERLTTIIIIGLGSFKNKLNAKNRKNLENIFNDIKSLSKFNLIVVDSIDNLVKISDDWAQEIIKTTNGIWIGNGITNQSNLKYVNEKYNFKKNIPSNNCYVVSNGKAVLTQYIEIFDSLDN